MSWMLCDVRLADLKLIRLLQTVALLSRSMAMDSVPVFEARLAKLGLSGFLNEFNLKGWKTFGDFAFSIPKGAPDDVKNLTTMANKLV